MPVLERTANDLANGHGGGDEEEDILGGVTNDTSTKKVQPTQNTEVWVYICSLALIILTVLQSNLFYYIFTIFLQSILDLLGDSGPATAPMNNITIPEPAKSAGGDILDLLGDIDMTGGTNTG